MNKKEWYDTILAHLPHGEDGNLLLSFDDACCVTKLLLKNGHAVCITGGDVEDDYRVSWIYAGDTEDLNWPNYDNIVFTSIDYLDEYPDALMNDIATNED